MKQHTWRGGGNCASCEDCGRIDHDGALDTECLPFNVNCPGTWPHTFNGWDCAACASEDLKECQKMELQISALSAGLLYEIRTRLKAPFVILANMVRRSRNNRRGQRSRGKKKTRQS